MERRSFLGAVGAGAVGVGVGVAGTEAVAHASQRTSTIDFEGGHQAGVTTDAQDNLNITAFDVTTRDRNKLCDLLKNWTDMARRLTRGEDPTGHVGDYDVPADSGEAVGLSASNLTLTIGFGPSLFDDRFGLASKKPKNLQRFPNFPGDQLVDELCYGDIVIQACADDPQVAVHAIRNLARAGEGLVSVKWSQLGFGRSSSTSKRQETPRNLFGFKDGTANIKSEEKGDVDKFVWTHDADQDWMNGGTYLCARRVRMLVETWDRQVLSDQEETFGRKKDTGAPLGAKKEYDDIPLDDMMGTQPVISKKSHIRLAHPSNNDGKRMLRRGYNFVEGTDKLGHLSVGLFFIAFVSDPQRGFVPIQMALSKNDKMNEYVRYESSAVFACPRGVSAGGYWGQELFS